MSSKKRHPAQAQEHPPFSPLPADDVLWKSVHDFNFWPAAEACISLLSGNPVALAKALIGRRGIGYALPRGYRRWMFLLREALLLGKVEGTIDASEWPAGELPLAVTMKNCSVHRLSFVCWMDDKGYKIPEPLRCLLPKENPADGAEQPRDKRGHKEPTAIVHLSASTKKKWEQLTVRIIDGDSIKMTHGAQRIVITKAEASQSRLYLRGWKVLLALAEDRGRLPKKDCDKRAISDLRKWLRDRYPQIPGNPIVGVKIPAVVLGGQLQRDVVKSAEFKAWQANFNIYPPSDDDRGGTGAMGTHGESFAEEIAREEFAQAAQEQETPVRRYRPTDT